MDDRGLREEGTAVWRDARQGRAGQGRATPEEPRELRRDGGASSNTGSLPLFGEMRVSVRGQGRTTGVYSYRTGKAGG